jgi:Papain-like cysteine protease AvrRpt2
MPITFPLLTVEKQQHSNWCWAAVAVSVARYYQKNGFNPPETECSLAGRFLSGKCCQEPFPDGACDLPHSLEDVLRHFNLLVGPQHGKFSFEVTNRLIQGGTPVPVYISWGRGAGHFVVLTNSLVTKDGDPAVYVSDPFFTSHWVLFDEFTQGYYPTSSDPKFAGTSGVWDWTFLL